VDGLRRRAVGAPTEIVGGVEHRGIVAMPEERDVKRVAIEMACCEHVGLVDGGAAAPTTLRPSLRFTSLALK